MKRFFAIAGGDKRGGKPSAEESRHLRSVPQPRPESSGGDGPSPGSLLELLVENVVDYAIFVLDLEGRIVTWNPGAQRLKGWTEEEVVGRHFSVFYPPEDIEAGKPDQELETAISEGRLEDEGWRVRKDGTRFWANVVISALRDKSGRLCGFGKVTRDLTERREMEQTRARLLATTETNRFKDEFLGQLSHELRTPLGALLGWVTMARDGTVPEKTRARALASIEKNTHALVRLVDDILDVTRGSKGKLRVEREPLDLAGPVLGALEAARPKAIGQGVHLSFHGPASETRVLGDYERLRQVISNLVGNAIKFTPKGGKVTVTLEREDRFAVVKVTDDGIGIDGDFLPFVFEPFRQAEGTNPVDGGLGLGLSIAATIVKAHRGRVTAMSDGRGKGSTFCLWLPLLRRKRSRKPRAK